MVWINFEYMEEVYIEFGKFTSFFLRLMERSKEKLIKMYIDMRTEKFQVQHRLFDLECGDLDELPEDDDLEEEK